MASDRKYSGLTKKIITIPAYSTATVEYNETLPNYYRVQNQGTNRIFCGTSHIPTEKRYDFAVGGEKVKMYAEPHNRNNLYILNPSGSEITVVVVSFQAEFDPTTIALSDLELDFSASSLETSTVITGFNSALPAGNNNLGIVKVSNFPTDYAKEGNQKDYTTLLNSIKTLVDSLNFSNGFIDNVNAWSSENQSSEHKINEDVNVKCHLHLLSNDGDTDITVTFTNNSNGYASTFTLKPGETIQDLKFVGGLSLTGNNYSYRVIVSYVE